MFSKAALHTGPEGRSSHCFQAQKTVSVTQRMLLQGPNSSTCHSSQRPTLTQSTQVLAPNRTLALSTPKTTAPRLRPGPAQSPSSTLARGLPSSPRTPRPTLVRPPVAWSKVPASTRPKAQSRRCHRKTGLGPQLSFPAPCSSCPSLREEPPLSFPPPPSCLGDSAILRTSPFLSLPLPYLEACHLLLSDSHPSLQAYPSSERICPSGACSTPEPAWLSTPTRPAHYSTHPPSPLPHTEAWNHCQPGQTRAVPPVPRTQAVDGARVVSCRFLHVAEKLQETNPHETGTNPGSVPTARKGKLSWDWHSWVAPP